MQGCIKKGELAVENGEKNKCQDKGIVVKDITITWPHLENWSRMEYIFEKDVYKDEQRKP